MNIKSVKEIANAVLYEGYMLYPYRASSVKNQMRWNFGVVYPKEYSDAQDGNDLCATQTECLVVGKSETAIGVKVRFLQAITRAVSAPDSPLSTLPDNPTAYFRDVPALRIGDQLLQAWQEAAEREIIVQPLSLAGLTREPHVQPFVLSAKREYEVVRGPEGQIAGLITRTRERIAGKVEVAAACVKDGIYKLRLRVSNETSIARTEGACRREWALLNALLSAHSILGVERGEFVSLLDPPDDLRQFASACCNTGTWPVLVGEDGQRDTMLSSPIILYDYPQIAPESPGNLFDGTEIDEILALRILTLTEDEKREMREGDERAREVLERTEALPAEHFAKLHGTLRGLRSTPGGRQ